MNNPVLPGATLGVLGSGQLGRMFAIAARRMGYRVHAYSPDRETPTGQVADREIYADYEDLAALADFAREVDVITFEFENVPAKATECVARYVPVRPRGEVLHIIQNRYREKTFLASNGFPTAPFVAVTTREELAAAVQRMRPPVVLKTAGYGYDGKGQAVIHEPEGVDAAWSKIGGVEAIVERFIDFRQEVSVVAARGGDGAFRHYGVIENQHHNHILDLSIPGLSLPDRLEAQALEISRGILEALDVVGVLCVEFFVTAEQGLLVNELAPRPHNSGHFSFDACITSQFEQQVRTICALPMGDTQMLRPCAMVNLLGELWSSGEPNWAAACADPAVKLHLYGKREARPARKMGHITAFGSDRESAARQAVAARAALAAAKV
ncbi:5-(carboxyamino)imidazole ribonucleotide synthase [Nitrococcus mobilis]|uniref:N5-carboxyaminoimidazole ribonucleotide synthase n=1 Tax=Nitrococcus mobilis Nb-231 TaxID=314278 RepID=A4BVM5_9GAMM|nr:5-(carboxyamino)imidazole ribonucleotide synthase [Nitrococcus mobilis]EAR20243.1 phosphoribosylaminoimidazole carboxylase [Nitrococcus mobilis Nb-231]